MITKYTIRNFKIHKESELTLAPLTILTGMNGTGKSSVFQSMLLLRDSYMDKSLPFELNLKGEQYDAGLSNMLNNRFSDKDAKYLELVIEDSENGELVFEFEYPDTGKNILQATERSVADTKVLGKTALFSDDFQYLSAFRNGPVDSSTSNSRVVDDHHQISENMGRGEYVAYFLHKYGSNNIPIKALAYEGTKTLLLQDQVDAWLNEISTGVKVKVEKLGEIYNMRFGYENPKKGKTEYFSALNTGYGISYILSVVVAVLSSKSGALLLIENPESHIHPAGQAALMRLLGKAAQNGVQIVLETHSDHIVNGALVAAKRKMVSPKKLSFYFFKPDDDHCSNPISVELGRNGRLKNAPEEFFNQMKLDFEALYEF